jgi:hypothetical protein
MQPRGRKLPEKNATGNSLLRIDSRASVATALWAVSTGECITELDRPQAGGYSTKVEKKRPRCFRGRLQFLLENNFVATASS